MTLTPSPMAAWTAAAESEPKQPLGAADLEHLDVRARRDAGDDAARDAEDGRRDAGVAGGRRRGVRAVAVVVAGAA